MRQRCTLRKPGGAGGVLNVDRVVELQHRFDVRQRLVRHAAALPEQRAPAILEHECLTQLRARALYLAEHAHVVGLAEGTRKDQERGRSEEHTSELQSL